MKQQVTNWSNVCFPDTKPIMNNLERVLHRGVEFFTAEKPPNCSNHPIVVALIVTIVHHLQEHIVHITEPDHVLLTEEVHQGQTE